MSAARDLRALVGVCGSALAPGAASPALDALAAWASLVASTNEKIDLTAARSDEELVDLLVADAMILAERVPRGASVVDVGTGAGAPGLGLAILRDDLDVTLVEPLDKRVSFLRTTIGTVLRGRARLPRVVRGRGESLGARTFDVAISRATLAPDRWLALGRRLAPSGDVWVLLARAEPPEEGARESVEYVWPLTGAQRRALGYETRT